MEIPRMNLTLPIVCMPWLMRAMELRIDVNQPHTEIASELEVIRRRLHRRGDVLYGIPEIPVDVEGLVFRYRETDGEHYVYVEDPARHCVAGYTVFNRLIEVNRKADRHLRAPHSKYAPAYQRRGIATAIYRWWLDAGHCLITGARQSAGANALWHSLGQRYDLFYVDLRDKTLRYLGHQVDDAVHEDLHTRMILLGKGCQFSEFAQRSGMLVPVEKT